MSIFFLVAVPLLFLAAILFLFGLRVLIAAKTGAGVEPTLDKYYLRDSLFSPAERSFYGALTSLDFEGVTVLVKVRLEDIFGVKAGLEPRDRQGARNRISSKHVDFLLIRSSDGRPIIGVELDDRSHEKEERKLRDAFVDTLFRSSGLPLLHVPAQQAYDVGLLHRQLEEVLNRKETAQVSV